MADVILERPTANCEIKFDASHLGYWVPEVYGFWWVLRFRV